ncbi:MAG: hypothetical protein U5O39_13405 [Gammaproteobacteria bacterium]|nr:hypothetical protein [Gammaproteobacteria bacterium]
MKTVDIQQHERERILLAHGASPLALVYESSKRLPVADAGYRIDRRQLLQNNVRLGQLLGRALRLPRSAHPPARSSWRSIDASCSSSQLLVLRRHRRLRGQRLDQCPSPPSGKRYDLTIVVQTR